ncbi:MAG: hypothetical protein ACTSU2_10120 [Promethearchaeota archaeon]
MAEGILVYRSKINGEIEILAEYMINNNKVQMDNKESNNNPIKEALLKDIVSRHGSVENLKEFIMVRAEDTKILSYYLFKVEDLNYFLIILLDLSQNLEDYMLNIDNYKAQFLKIIQEGGSTNDMQKSLMNIIKDILIGRNTLLNDLKDKQKIEKYLSTKANKLLDEGDLEKAQDLIKLAQEVPEKLANAVNNGDRAFSERNYKKAAKFYDDAASLAKKIGHIQMVKVLLRRVKRAEEIPELIKSWSDVLSQINKPLKKRVPIKEINYYAKIIPFIEKAIDIADILEDDKKVKLLRHLIELCTEGSKLSNELGQIDKEIKETTAEILK